LTVWAHQSRRPRRFLPWVRGLAERRPITSAVMRISAHSGVVDTRANGCDQHVAAMGRPPTGWCSPPSRCQRQGEQGRPDQLAKQTRRLVPFWHASRRLKANVILGVSFLLCLYCTGTPTATVCRSEQVFRSRLTLRIGWYLILLDGGQRVGAEEGNHERVTSTSRPNC
jgi:hypothetical protein